LFAGPIFTREAVVAPRRPRLFAARVVYGFSLLLLIATAWMILQGTQEVRNLSELARFGTILFQILAPLQLVVLMFLSAIQAASNVAIEKDKQTLVLLLLTRLSNTELVLGKLLASLLGIANMLATSLPIFMLLVLFGGTSFWQVLWTFAVTAASCLVAGAFGNMIALWREKTFQTLALVVLGILVWVGAWEAIALLQGSWGSFDLSQAAAACSPFQAIVAASRPDVAENFRWTVVPFLLVATGLWALLNLIAIWRVRYWNPSRDVRPGQQEAAMESSLLRDSTESPVAKSASEQARSGHIDDRSRQASRRSRRVWDNPVLWRECCTWAYGRKILFIRVVYWLASLAAGFALYSMVNSGAATFASAGAAVEIPLVARVLAPLLVVSLVILNSLAVTSITTERDGKALDLLQVTDLSPREFLFGKLLGVLYVGLDIVLLPLVLCTYLWWNGAVSGENLFYLLLSMAILNVFVVVLGIHAGLSHANSRTAIGVSLGTVFFLFLGMITCMLMLISFTGNVEFQLTPFLACIIGGAVGLYVALGWHLQSSALAFASAVLPLAMFYCITSLLLKNYTSAVLVLAFTYGFAITAMVVPRLSEFRFAQGRSKLNEDG
jgi:ABC-type Na+ efflux pump permease subunit